MRCSNRGLLLAVVAAAVCAGSTANAQYTLTTLATFNGTNGANLFSGVIADASGNLYGTTVGGGANNDGTVFEVNPNTQVLTTLATFNGANNGANPTGGLIFDASGNLYGTTSAGGAGTVGTVFELNPNTQALTTLATFNNTNGGNPFGTLIADSGGNLYGTAQTGGANNDGIVFELNPNTQVLATLATFAGTNGGQPLAGLLADAGGNLYGTTSGGGANIDGTVFKVAAVTYTLTNPASFGGTNGRDPFGSLIADASGNLYGTTQYGGVNGVGTVFELDPNTDVLTTLFSFDGTNGFDPVGNLIFDASGNLYGETSSGGAYGYGTVFELDPNTQILTTLFSFNGPNGIGPEGGLIFDASGNLYGTTDGGGMYGDGTVFELSPVPEPPSLALSLLAVGGLAFLFRTKLRNGARAAAGA